MLDNEVVPHSAVPQRRVSAETDITKKNSLVRKTFAILRAFHDPQDCLTSQELSERVNMHKASCHRLVQTLAEVGALTRGPHGRYRLGMGLLSLSRNVASHELLRQIGNPILTELGTRLDLTMHLGVLEGGMVLYLTKVATRTSFPTHTRPGCYLEAYCSGLGKVLLSALQEDQLESFILDGDLVALTPNTITERSMLRSELNRVRALGFAIDNCESRIDTYCVAVPVRDLDGNVVAAISATCEAQSVTGDAISSLCGELIGAARDFTKQLYPQG